jgi:hypothetical protein
MLKTAVTTYGTEKNWDFIARDVGRTGDQYLDRWNKHVNPSINYEPWTPEEKNNLWNWNENIRANIINGQ